MNWQACAHLRVSWRTLRLPNGHLRGWWECDSDCGARFVVLPKRDEYASFPMSEPFGGVNRYGSGEGGACRHGVSLSAPCERCARLIAMNHEHEMRGEAYEAPHIRAVYGKQTP